MKSGRINYSNNESWVEQVVINIPTFIENMKTDIPGKFKHSYTGDLHAPEKGWGLIQTILAIKIKAILKNVQLSQAFNNRVLAEAILSFEKENGYILDPLVNKNGFLIRLKSGLRSFHIPSIFYNKEAVAMTRSSYNALFLLKHKPSKHYKVLDYSEKNIRK